MEFRRVLFRSEDKKPEEKPAEPIPEPEIKDQNYYNNQKRINLENKFKITIKYGEEMVDFKPLNLEPTFMTEPFQIKKYLMYLENELNKYPENLFAEPTNKANMPLTIYLIDSIPNKAFGGLTSYRNNQPVIITLNAQSQAIDRVIHHEIMHYMHVYINAYRGLDNEFNAWEQYLPDGFNYGDNNEAYNCHTPNGVPNSFCNSYAQSAFFEDVASTFEYMTNNVGKPICFIENELIHKKALLLVQILENNFDSIIPGAWYYWKRHL